MRINSNYSLCTVGGAKYLLPYAQGICDHKRGVKLNATGVVIWEAIVRGLSGDALLEHVAEYYEASEEEVAIIKEDIDAFLIQLTSMDIIIEDEIGVRVMNVPKHYIQIGPISLEIFCFDKLSIIFLFRLFLKNVNLNCRHSVESSFGIISAFGCACLST